MSFDDSKKRKACQSCTRSKAKCSPSENTSDLCYRCQRLGKSCVFEETVRKRVPKSRSRVKQLEQRVETLIDLLAANGQNMGVAQKTDSVPHLPTSTLNESSLRSANHALEDAQQPAPYITPAETPESFDADDIPFHPYDPVEAGVLTQDTASALLKEFGDSFIQSFPFVVVLSTTDAHALRMNSPFLFLAIMTVTTYRTPAILRCLHQELKEQIATRIVRRSHKSLEILQGLLIYGSWYHFLYDPKHQQMAMIVQLCVAMVQDLGIAKYSKEKLRRLPTLEEQSSLILKSERSFAERRAFLGTFYLTVGFAQAWRKRGTMPHTRYMAQCCQIIAERKEHASDMFITPLIELSELTCRINDYFSYDDIDNAEVHGDMILSSTTLNFRSDLERIRNSIPADAKSNRNLYLGTCLVELAVYECALHSTLWSSPSPSDVSSISVNRTVALYHCLNAMNAYLNELLGISRASLYHLTFSSWSGWFYAIIVACKLVFLEDNERRSQTDLDSVSRTVSKLFCEKLPETPSTLWSEKTIEGPSCDPCKGPLEINATSMWDPIAVAREAEVPSLFDKFIEKMQFTEPSDPNALNSANPIFDPLFSMLCLQRSLLHGFTKRMKDHVEKLAKPETILGSGAQGASSSPKDIGDGASGLEYADWNSSSAMSPQARQRLVERYRNNPIPLLNTFQFNSINFDTIAPLDPLSMPQLLQDDLLWDTVMDDFTFPV